MISSKASYAVCKTAYLRDRSWLPSFSIFICTICLPNFQKVCLCSQFSIVTLFWKLVGLERNFKPRHDYTFSVSPDFGLKLCHIKTVTAALNLNYREAKRQLKVYNNNRLLSFCQTVSFSAVWSSGWSAVLMINMVSVQNPLAPFCCVLGKATLWHFPCLVVLASISKFQLYLY